MKEYTVIINDNGYKFWRLNGKLHREDGPAFEWASGAKFWYLNGKIHREDGPAVEYANGDKYWYLNDKRHREDGPAVEHADGDKEWYLDGIEYTQAEFLQKTKKDLKSYSCAGKVIEVDGKKYKLMEI